VCSSDLADGPDENVRSSTNSLLLAEVEGPGGQRARTLLETPSGYALTPVTAVECVRRTLAGEITPGFHTPATALGAKFILDLPGCRWWDLD
jgi:short subunit dehydrogenase-like uncharacterized protein